MEPPTHCATPWGAPWVFAAHVLHPRNFADSVVPYSLGDPNARPPTPQRTPTAVLSSPLLQTPKQNSSHFDETSGWTPRFAEEYSVFNSTPGNLRGTSSGSGAFNLDFAPLSPVPPSTGKKRPLSAEGVALQIATHANHFTADPANLAPVDAARRLPSSPDPLTLSHKDAAAAAAAGAGVGTSNITPKAQHAQLQQQPQQQGGQRSAKKSRGSSVSGGAAVKSPLSAHRQTQTATPPPSSRGGRKLAPKPQTDNMQNQGFSQPDFSSAQPPPPPPPPPPPQLNTAFVTGNPEDVFGYPMGPATAPPITGPRPFWGFDMDTTGMDTSGMAIDVDLSTAGADLFQTPTQGHSLRPMSSMEWGSANFQQTPLIAQAEQQHQQQPPAQSQGQLQGQDVQQDHSTRRGRPLAPKTTTMTTPEMNESPTQNFTFNSFQMMDNPFNTSPGGVDPGLLFSQTASSAPMNSNAMAMSMSMSMSMDNTPSRPASSTPTAMAPTTAGMTIEPVASNASTSADGNPQRSGSQGQGQGQSRKLDRAPAISPIKNQAGRPNLSRSFSESARSGKRTVGGGRSSLPALAPARPVTIHQPSLPPPPPPPPTTQGNTRPQTQGGRSGGRSSPLKSSHHRLSSLTAIPENTANVPARSRSAKRTSVKFVIDENGRARAETIVDEDDDPEPAPLSSSSSQQSIKRNSWAGPLSIPGPVPVPDSDEEYMSSSDDEPIIIPSRNTSFSYPDPPKSSGLGNSRPPTASSIFSQTLMRHRSVNDRQSSSFRRSSQMEPDAVDAMDIDPPQQPAQPQPQPQPQRPSTGGSLGDAAAELRKVMQAGNPRRPSSGQQRPPALGSGGSSGHRQRFTPGQRSSSSTISEASLPPTSPPQGREQSQIRCVCNRPEAGEGVFLIKWYVYNPFLVGFPFLFYL